MQDRESASCVEEISSTNAESCETARQVQGNSRRLEHR